MGRAGGCPLCHTMDCRWVMISMSSKPQKERSRLVKSHRLSARSLWRGVLSSSSIIFIELTYWPFKIHLCWDTVFDHPMWVRRLFFFSLTLRLCHPNITQRILAYDVVSHNARAFFGGWKKFNDVSKSYCPVHFFMPWALIFQIQLKTKSETSHYRWFRAFPSPRQLMWDRSWKRRQRELKYFWKLWD